MTKGITNRSDFKHVLSTSLPMQSYIPTTISGGGVQNSWGKLGGGGTMFRMHQYLDLTELEIFYLYFQIIFLSFYAQY